MVVGEVDRLVTEKEMDFFDNMHLRLDFVPHQGNVSVPSTKMTQMFIQLKAPGGRVWMPERLLISFISL